MVSGHPSNPLPHDPGNFPAQVHASTTAQAAGGAQFVPGPYPHSSGHPHRQLAKHWPGLFTAPSWSGVENQCLCLQRLCNSLGGGRSPAPFRAQLEVARLLVVASHRFLFSEQRLSFLSCEGRAPFTTASQVQMLMRVCQLPNVSSTHAPRLLGLLAGIRAYVCFAGGQCKSFE